MQFDATARKFERKKSFEIKSNQISIICIFRCQFSSVYKTKFDFSFICGHSHDLYHAHCSNTLSPQCCKLRLLRHAVEYIDIKELYCVIFLFRSVVISRSPHAVLYRNAINSLSHTRVDFSICKIVVAYRRRCGFVRSE